MSVHLMCATFCEFAMFSHQLVGYHYTHYFMYYFFCVVMRSIQKLFEYNNHILCEPV
jgi:hypothetical protein